jgi:hypothetical protein
MESLIDRIIAKKDRPVAILVRTIGLLCFFVFGLSAVSIGQSTWNGNLSTSWTDPSNWNGNSVPGTNATVVIPNTTNIPIISSNVTIQNLEISQNGNGGQLIVTSGATLTVSNQLDLPNNGALFLDNGHLQFNGNGNGNRKINYGYTNTLIRITNGGSLNSPFAYLQVNGDLDIQNGNMTLGNGFQVS